jgi:mRNA-degrading endonuclease RelE of RelBE toxin-antitoxin system
MSFDIVLTAEAIEDGKALRARLRAEVRRRNRNASAARAGEDEPQPHQAASRAASPQYRLRVGDIRVFYDVIDKTVEILGIVAKSEADAWLTQFGKPE